MVAILLIIGVVIFGYRWWQWSNQDYVITNRRLLKVTGILNKHSADSSLEKINDAILDQPCSGGCSNYGDLTILTAAEEAVDSTTCSTTPRSSRRSMLTQKHTLETEFMYAGAMPPTPPLRAEPTSRCARSRMQPAAPPPPAAVAPDARATAADLPRPAPADGRCGRGRRRPPTAADASLEVTQTLARLADLRDSGAITPAEYESKKQELLGRL